MGFAVLLTNDAANDLDNIYDYIAFHDSPQKANYVLERFEKVCASQSEFPERGAYPNEFLALGIREYRETFLSLIASYTELWTISCMFF